MMSPGELVTLGGVRDELGRQEDGIIHALLERSRLSRNADAYVAGAASAAELGFGGAEGSLLEQALRATERVHGRLRRYDSPGERAFFPDALPGPAAPSTVPVLMTPWMDVDMNREVVEGYVERVVPAVTRPGADASPGPAVIADVRCLQSLSKRVHLGLYVAEAKFRADRELYTRLIGQNDRGAIMDSLTDAAVERRVAARVREKADAHDWGGGGATPASVVAVFVDWLMPLTKAAQVRYFMRRLDGGGGRGLAPPTGGE